MDDVNRRIELVTAELRKLEHELMWTAVDDADSEKLRLLDGANSTRLVTEFKLAVDGMRRFLWAYIEAADRYRGAGMNYALQTARLQRATEMLHSLHQELGDSERQEARELLEQVAELVRSHQERRAKAGS
jgi:hypothetical protein